MFWLYLGPETPGFPQTITRESSLEYANFFKHALARGIYLPPSPYEVSFLSTAHTPSLLTEVIESLCRK
jgi:glutamate-1-semialdehyde 2,1-aminomutase